jgi:hypothetical protein
VQVGVWRRLLTPLVFASFAGAAGLSAAGPADTVSTRSTPVLQRFLTLSDPDPTQYRALRHLDAQSEHFDRTAWMDVWTEGDAHGFRYQIVAEGGSPYILNKVFRATLEAEQKIWAAGGPQNAAITPANYVFEERGAEAGGLASIAMTPKRKDNLLVEGALYLRPEDGDLVRMEGKLVKAPSFWTRNVEIIRRFQRFVGIRLPVALESVANVRIAGRSTFKMSYEYETVNGHRVGTPQLRAQTTDLPR